MSTGVEVVYIDGFAGKGKFDDGTSGSPLLVKEKVYQARANSKFNTKITPYFVEYEHADILRSNLCDASMNVVQGDYKNFFNKQAKAVVDFCETNRKTYHIKKGTITGL